MKKKTAGKPKTRSLPAKALTAKQATKVKGGKPVKYMEIKLKEVFVSNVQTGGHGTDNQN